MIRKILVANRGEVAVRIVRACAEMEIKSVAIYSDADRHALHVKKADEAYNVGPDPIGGYLNAHRIVNLALAAGCDALHPGYGFLSENPQLAEICQRRGIIFIGPPAEVIRRMGDKTQARQTMMATGVTVIPGSEGNLKDLKETLRLAKKIGYPVMLKATSGGGGRGIRLCNNDKELRNNYDRVISEATKAFGNAEIFLEKAIIDPRHIEVQILGDTQGNVIHLFERDCSIQRRHQKLVEVAPSPQLSEAQRQKVCAMAVKAAKYAGYVNAGTVEFLLDSSGNFYFLEMNTRLQVEHTITEQITGIDIVKQQILIADNQPLSYTQEEISWRGFAVQFRVNAEDPKNDFLPNFGRVTRYYSPGGPGVRTDAAIYTGYVFPPHYDSLCAKITVWALTWKEVIFRARRALMDLGLHGVKTTKPFCMEILKSREFQEGNFTTNFIEQHPELVNYSVGRPPADLAAAISAAISAYHGL